MFNYLFPIFCFGLVITGIVFLGIIEAAKQVKAESHPEPSTQDRNEESEVNSSLQRPSAALPLRQRS